MRKNIRVYSIGSVVVVTVSGVPRLVQEPRVRSGLC